MWNLKYDIDELIYKTETDIQNRPVVAKGEVGICSYNLLSIEWINNKVLLYSTGNYIQYPLVNYHEKEYEKEHVILLLLFSHYVMSNSCDPLDCSLPGFSVHGISQARILEWVAISFIYNTYTIVTVVDKF